jgi:hypothetical protein
MNRFRRKLIGGLAASAAVGLVATQLASCAQDAHAAEPKVAVSSHSQSALEDLAEQCGLDVNCEAGGIAEGNARISGVASVDAFFASVITFQAKADNVSAGIEAELDAIRGDFGLAAGADLEAGIQAQITANVEGSLEIEAEPARCTADVSATLDAQARCEATATPPMAMVKCEGSCQVEASADVECSAEADLKCTATAPGIECEGSCQGSCEADFTAAAACSGTCRGTCSGNCSAYAGTDMGANAECAGTCDGMCQGTCEVEISGGATCEGECKGECTVTNPEAGCEGGIRAECEAQANAMVDCEGRCDGEVTPPMVSAECEASVKADAKMNVECTPPRLAINYRLQAAAGAELDAQLKFVAAVENLKVRLPALLVAIKRANLALEAGADLGASAQSAIDGAVTAAGMGNARIFFGLKCALGQIDAVGTVVSESSTKLQSSLTASAELTSALGL